jgi:predicted NAD/FAD-dependent oxidoreductase
VTTRDTQHDVLIIGAGISGLTAARALRDAGRQVTVLEKSRGLGGRSATRRWNGLPVDHGAQFFTARSPEFRDEVRIWTARGTCFVWADGFHQHAGGALCPPGSEAHPRYACRHGMSALARELAGDSTDWILRETRATGVACGEGAWRVSADNGTTHSARALIVTAPPEQGATLLREAAPEAAGELDRTPMTPCFALAACFPQTPFPWQGIQLSGHPVLSWIGHDTSKRPELHPGVTILMLHATPEFSAERFAAPPEDIRTTMLEAASVTTGCDLRHPAGTFLQRWRYAAPAISAPAPLVRIHTQPAPLLLCGDALGGGKIEGAWRSGQAAARSLLDHLAGRPRLTA